MEPTYTTLSSCSREDPLIIQTDFLIQDVDMGIISQYNVIFVPSGGHWDHLSTFEGTSNLISSAYAAGLIIASLCIGKVVLAKSGILNGIQIAYDSNAWTYMDDSGAIMIQQEVVIDRRIITGGPGGGLTGGGASVAPTIEVCEAIAAEIQAMNIGLTVAISSGIAGAAVVSGFIIYRKKHKKR